MIDGAEPTFTFWYFGLHPFLDWIWFYARVTFALHILQECKPLQVKWKVIFGNVFLTSLQGGIFLNWCVNPFESDYRRRNLQCIDFVLERGMIDRTTSCDCIALGELSIWTSGRSNLRFKALILIVGWVPLIPCAIYRIDLGCTMGRKKKQNQYAWLMTQT